MKTNAVIENILGRRSVRAYAAAPVAREDLETIVACGQWAPSGVNKQEWCFIVVDDRTKIARLCEAMRRALARDSYDMYNPAAIIIVGHVRGAHLGKQDDGCAMENMMLRFGIGYNTLLNTSTSHIAEMIIKGSNNGVLEMEKVLAHNEEFAGSPCRSLAKELIEMENANIRTLKEYL